MGESCLFARNRKINHQINRRDAWHLGNVITAFVQQPRVGSLGAANSACPTHLCVCVCFFRKCPMAGSPRCSTRRSPDSRGRGPGRLACTRCFPRKRSPRSRGAQIAGCSSCEARGRCLNAPFLEPPSKPFHWRFKFFPSPGRVPTRLSKGAGAQPQDRRTCILECANMANVVPPHVGVGDEYENGGLGERAEPVAGL